MHKALRQDRTAQRPEAKVGRPLKQEAPLAELSEVQPVEQQEPRLVERQEAHPVDSAVDSETYLAEQPQEAQPVEQREAQPVGQQEEQPVDSEA